MSDTTSPIDSKPKPITEEEAKQLLRDAIAQEIEVGKIERQLRQAKDDANAARDACLSHIPSGRYLVDNVWVETQWTSFTVLLEEGDSFKSEKISNLGEELCAKEAV